MEINIWQVLFQAVNFGVILFVLNKVLYKPVMKMLDDRAKKINEGMAAAEKNLKEAGEIEKLKKAEVAKARKDAAAIIRQAEVEAKKAADSILEASKKKAKDEAERIVKNAESEIAAASGLRPIACIAPSPTNPIPTPGPKAPRPIARPTARPLRSTVAAA